MRPVVGVEFKVLGPLSDAGRRVEIGARKRWLVLAVLLARAGQVIGEVSLLDGSASAEAIEGSVALTLSRPRSWRSSSPTR